MSIIQFPGKFERMPVVTQHSDGGGGDGMGPRIAKLESDVEYIKRDIGEIKVDMKEIRSDLKSDFRVLFSALVAAVLGLAGLMAHGFKWI